MAFDNLGHLVNAAFEAARPPDYMNVIDAGQKFHVVEPSALHRGTWSPDLTPYMNEFQEVLTSLEFQGAIFAGPARCGKSVALPNWLAYGAKVDPADYLIVHSAQHEARNWSKSDLAKFIRRSEAVRAMMIPGRKNDNTFDKEFLSGMRWLITWPTIGNLSGKTIPRHWLVDFDRIPQDVDGEGNPYDLTAKRGETYMRFAMTVAESSPGFDIEDPKWSPRTPHEAPPTEGILKLYNRGDKRRWNWPCAHCKSAFEPTFGLFDFPGKLDPKEVYHDPMDAAEQVRLICPKCRYPHTSDLKPYLNNEGTWVKEGMMWIPKTGEVLRDERYRLARSNIGSFWLKGPAAAFQTWENIVLTWLRANKEYDEIGDEKLLRKTTNTDHGEPYLPRAMISDRNPERLKERAENWGASEDNRTVPPWVRFLVATVDVQARSSSAFVVQIHGADAVGDLTVIDSFKIIKSDRFDGEGDRLRLDPAAFAGDWDVLVDQVMNRSYPLGDGSGRRMKVYLTGCDSGGAEGVTMNAYAFWRRLKGRQDGSHRRFILIKGKGGKRGKDDEVDKPDEQTPPTRVLWPDSNQTKGSLKGATGDVPVLELNPWLLKDTAATFMSRRVRDEDSGVGGMLRYPEWMPDWFYSQLTNEVRSAKGWEKIGSRRNEAWDLLYYALGLLVRPKDETTFAPWLTINWHKIPWSNPPAWAAEWERNVTIFDPNAKPDVLQIEATSKKLSFAELAEKLA